MWHALNSLIHDQIDYILVPQHFKLSIKKAKTRSSPGADMGSNHDLVLCSLKCKLNVKHFQKSSHICFDLEKLKDQKIAKVSQAQVSGEFAALNIIDSVVNTLVDDIKEVLVMAAEDMLGRWRKKKQSWVANEILNLCDERWSQKRVKHNDPEMADWYRLLNSKIWRKMKEAKEDCIEGQCSIIKEGIATGNSKMAYQTLKTPTKTQQLKSSVTEDNSGSLLMEGTAVLNWWTEYCRNLYKLQTPARHQHSAKWPYQVQRD